MTGIDIFWGTPDEKSYRRKYNPTANQHSYKITEVVNEEDLNQENTSNSIRLCKGKEYLLGLDMSTSQSGVYITDTKMKPVAMIDLVNRNMRLTELSSHLASFFICNFADVKFKHVILEEQIATKNGRMIFGKLSELQGAILGLSYIFNLEIERIKPEVWRKHFLISSEYDGRRKNSTDLKIAAKEEVLKRNSSMQSYITVMEDYSKSSQARVCDSCDAAGVLHGFIEENYGKPVPEGLRRVSKTMQKEDKHIRKYSVYTYNQNENTFRKLKDDYKTAGVTGENTISLSLSDYCDGIVNKRGCRILAYNQEMSLEDNVSRATTTTNKLNILLVGNGYAIQQMAWESGIPLRPGEVYTILCFRRDKKKGVD